MASTIARIEYLEMALDRLEESIQIFKRYNKADDLYDTCRDSIIQRFEFSFDLFWKCLKDYLERQYGISVASPRSVFRNTFEQGLVNEKEYEVLENMIGDRNDASHRYDQVMAEEVVHNVSLYCQLMIDKLNQFLQNP